MIFLSKKKEYLIPALQAKGLQLTIEADSNLAFVANAIRGLRTRIDRLHADSLTTYIRGGNYVWTLVRYVLFVSMEME